MGEFALDASCIILARGGHIYQCSLCGREWSDEDAADNEHLCIKKCGGTLERAAELELERLPAVLVAPARDWLKEPDARLKLWGAAELAELCLKLGASWLLAWVRSQPGAWNDALKNTLGTSKNPGRAILFS